VRGPVEFIKHYNEEEEEVFMVRKMKKREKRVSISITPQSGTEG
jgi:hypothetical protein